MTAPDDLDTGATGSRSLSTRWVGNDPRGELTRQRVFDAVRGLMSERASDISVADIVRIAGISRSSFYAHFSGLDEVAAEMLGRQFEQIGEFDDELRPHDLSPRRAAARHGYERLIAHMVENSPLYSGALDLPMTRRAYDDVVHTYSARLMESVILLGQVPDGVDPHIVSTYAAGGATTLISAWMRGQIEISDDELASQLVDLLPPWVLEPTQTEPTQTGPTQKVTQR